MKKSILVYGIVYLAILAACEKSEDPKPDNITMEQLNKTITAAKSDSIPGVCKDIAFNIAGNEIDGFEAYLSINTIPILCDGESQFLVDESTDKIKALTENIEVSEKGKWIGSHKLDLDLFTGQGEKYIGYRIVTSPDGMNSYYYGWIKIDLSSNKTILKILSRATNQTRFNDILTGQID